MGALNELRDKVTAIATAHGFTEASIPEDVALMHSELSELLEDFRDGHPPTFVWYLTPQGQKTFQFWPEGHMPRKPCGIPSEVADIIIRALHFAGKHRIDIESAIAEKVAYNEHRPFKHGKVL